MTEDKKEYKVTVTKSGKSIQCSSKDEEMLVELAQDAVDGNRGLMLTRLSFQNLYDFKMDGSVIKVTYKEQRELPVGWDNSPMQVEEIKFLLGEEESFVVCTCTDCEGVYSVPGDIYGALIDWLESK
ncbi:MAG: hypothetical protein IJW37_09465 [Lachnospiraceae bacterium]|nr:hypothetical protein [Lachnospiraceae bacterium]